MKETEIILGTILYQVKKAKTLEEIEDAIEVMCSKDDIAAVEQKINKHGKKER